MVEQAEQTGPAVSDENPESEQKAAVQVKRLRRQLLGHLICEFAHMLYGHIKFPRVVAELHRFAALTAEDHFQIRMVIDRLYDGVPKFLRIYGTVEPDYIGQVVSHTVRMCHAVEIDTQLVGGHGISGHFMSDFPVFAFFRGHFVYQRRNSGNGAAFDKLRHLYRQVEFFVEIRNQSDHRERRQAKGEQVVFYAELRVFEQ